MIMKKLLVFTAGFFLAFNTFALPFNSKLSNSEKEKLSQGQVIARNIDKYKNLSIDSENETAKRLRNEIYDLDPNYLAEMAQIRPVEGNEDLIEKMYEVLSDIDSYAGIPYWSVRHERYFDLYKTAEVVKKEEIIHVEIDGEEKLYCKIK